MLPLPPKKWGLLFFLPPLKKWLRRTRNRANFAFGAFFPPLNKSRRTDPVRYRKGQKANLPLFAPFTSSVSLFLQDRIRSKRNQKETMRGGGVHIPEWRIFFWPLPKWWATGCVQAPIGQIHMSFRASLPFWGSGILTSDRVDSIPQKSNQTVDLPLEWRPKPKK